MDHIAIMNKSWKLIPKIISGEKTIESRWYKTKRTPWDHIKEGDRVFFKNSGENVIASAMVAKVLQFTIDNIDNAQYLVERYGNEVCLINKDVKTWKNVPNYCILIYLHNPESLKNPFTINKKGFGIGAAWITVKNIEDIKI